MPTATMAMMGAGKSMPAVARCRPQIRNWAPKKRTTARAPSQHRLRLAADHPGKQSGERSRRHGSDLMLWRSSTVGPGRGGTGVK